MFSNRIPVKHIALCWDSILANFSLYLKQITSITKTKVKMMKRGFEIPKPKVLKNGHHYLDRLEIEALLQKMVLVFDHTSDTQNSLQLERTLKRRKFKDFSEYFFRVLAHMLFESKKKQLHDDLNLEKYYIFWCLKLNKIWQLVQLVQNQIMTETLILALILCEIGSKAPVLESIQDHNFKIKRQLSFFQGVVFHSGHKSSLQFGLQMLKRLSK